MVQYDFALNTSLEGPEHSNSGLGCYICGRVEDGNVVLTGKATSSQDASHIADMIAGYNLQVRLDGATIRIAADPRHRENLEVLLAQIREEGGINPAAIVHSLAHRPTLG